jgi:hypothetical protein
MLTLIIQTMRHELRKTKKPSPSPLWPFDSWVILQQTIIDLEKIAQEPCPKELSLKAEKRGAEREGLLGCSDMNPKERIDQMGQGGIVTMSCGSGIGIGGNAAAMGSGSGVGGFGGGGTQPSGQTSGGGGAGLSGQGSGIGGGNESLRGSGGIIG